MFRMKRLWFVPNLVKICSIFLKLPAVKKWPSFFDSQCSFSVFFTTKRRYNMKSRRSRPNGGLKYGWAMEVFFSIIAFSALCHVLLTSNVDEILLVSTIHKVIQVDARRVLLQTCGRLSVVDSSNVRVGTLVVGLRAFYPALGSCLLCCLLNCDTTTEVSCMHI